MHFDSWEHILTVDIDSSLAGRPLRPSDECSAPPLTPYSFSTLVVIDSLNGHTEVEQGV